MKNLTHRPLSFAILFFLCFLYLLLTPGQAQQSFRTLDLSNIQTNYEGDKANRISNNQQQQQEKPDESRSMKEDRKLEQQKGPDQLVTKSEDLGERQNQNDLQQQIERLQKQLQKKRERLQKRSQTAKQQNQNATATAENKDKVQGNSDGSIQVGTNQLTVDQDNLEDNQKSAPLQDKPSGEIDGQEVSQNKKQLQLKDKKDLVGPEVDKNQGNTAKLPSHNMQGAEDASIQSKASQKSTAQQTNTHIDALTKDNGNLLTNPEMESQESNVEKDKNDNKDEPDNNKIPEDTIDANKNSEEDGKLIQAESKAQQSQNADGNEQIDAKDKPQRIEEEMTDKQNPNPKSGDLSGTKPEINKPIDYRPQIDYEPARLINPQHPSNKTALQTQQTVNPQDILIHQSDGKNHDNNLNSNEIPNSGDEDSKSNNENNKNSEIHEVERSDQGSKEDSQMNVPVEDSQKGTEQLLQTNEEMKQNQSQQTENKESDELKRPQETSSRDDKYFDSIPTPYIIDNDVPSTPKIKDDSPTSTNDLLSNTQNPVADAFEGKDKIHQADPQVQTNTKQDDLNQQQRLKPEQNQSQKEISGSSQQDIRIQEGQNEKESIKKKELEGRIIKLEQQLKMLNQHPASEQSPQNLRKGEVQDNSAENDSRLKVSNLEQRLETALQKLSEIQNKISSQNQSPTPSIQDEFTSKLSELENKLGQLQSQHSIRQSMGQPFQGKADQGLSKGHDDRDSFNERQNQKDREIQRLKANVDSLNNKLNTLESLIHQTALNSMQTTNDDAENTKINQRDGSIQRDIPTNHKDQSTNEHNIIVQQINNSVETPEQKEIEQKGDVIKNGKNHDSQVQQQNTQSRNSGATPQANRKQQQRQNEQESIESPASQQKDENIKTQNKKQSIEQQKKLEEPRQIKEADKFGQQDQFSQQKQKSDQQKLENTDSQSKGLAPQELTAPTQQNQKTIKARDSRQGNLKKDDKRSKDQEQAQLEDKKELSTDHLSSELQSSQTIDEQPKSLSKDLSKQKGSLEKEDSKYQPEQLQSEQKEQELEKPKSQKIVNKKDSSFLLGISFNQFILYSSLGAAVLLILKKFFKDNTNSLHATQSPRSALSIDASIQQFQENRQPQSTVDKLKKQKYVDIDNDQPSSERRMQRQQLNEQPQIASPYDVDSQSFPNQQLSTASQIEPINFKDNLTQRPKLIKPIQKPVSKTALQKFNRVAIPAEFTQAQQIINFLDNRNPLQSQISINPSPVNKAEEGVLQIQPSVVSKIVPQNETISRPFVLDQNYQDSTYENPTIDKSQMNLNNDDQFLEFSQATRNNELKVVQKPQMEIQVDNQSVLHYFEIPNIVDNQTYASRSPSASPGIIKQSHALEITGQSHYNNRQVFRPAEKPILMPYQEDEQFEEFQQSSTSHPNDQPALHQDPSSEQFQEGQIISIVRDSFEQPIIQSLSVQPSQSLQQDSTIINNVNERTPNIEIITNNKNEEDDPFSHLE